MKKKSKIFYAVIIKQKTVEVFYFFFFVFEKF